MSEHVTTATEGVPRSVGCGGVWAGAESSEPPSHGLWEPADAGEDVVSESRRSAAAAPPARSDWGVPDGAAATAADTVGGVSARGD